jgi:hypothetical protein
MKQKKKLDRPVEDKEESPDINEEEAQDIYDENDRQEMLEEDEITEAEYSFMAGREIADKKKKKDSWLEKKVPEETASVDQAQNEYQDD